ncbi:hypothetical protein KA005_00010, partial [bacterium]|nr:hypothetical protein [bacterium]
SQYDVENVISKEDFRFSSVCLKTGVVAKEVTENKHRIEELAKKAMDDIWLSNDEIPVNPGEISGIWLLSSVPSKLFNAFAKAKIDVEGMLKEVVSTRFEDGGLKWDDVIKGAMLHDSICEIDGKCFRNKVKEIEVVSRVALNRAMAERRFEELNSCLDRVWEEVACGEGERNPLVRIARTQKQYMEKIRG